MQLYSTKNARWKSGLQYWAEISRQLNFPVELRPIGEEPFSADMRIASIGDLSFAEVCTSPAHISRSQSAIELTGEQFYFVHLAIKGKSRFAHGGRVTELRPGDLVLTYSHEPTEIANARPARALSVQIPRHLLEHHLPNAGQLCGIRIDGRGGAAKIMATLLPSIWRQISNGIPPETHKFLGSSVLSVLNACLITKALQPDLSDQKSGRQVQAIRRFIDEHLMDPDLSPTTIATYHGLSLRQLHRMFQNQSETLWQYVIRRRLEEAAKRLTTPEWRNSSVSDIGFQCGFNSLAHFSRSFKEHFALSPTHFRQSGGTTGGDISLD